MANIEMAYLTLTRMYKVNWPMDFPVCMEMKNIFIKVFAFVKMKLIHTPTASFAKET